MSDDRGLRNNPLPEGPRAEEIRCSDCAHYYITYNPDFPYGCRAVGFKSKVLPDRAVAAHSKLPCQFFTAKARRHG